MLVICHKYKHYFRTKYYLLAILLLIIGHFNNYPYKTVYKFKMSLSIYVYASKLS